MKTRTVLALLFLATLPLMGCGTRPERLQPPSGDKVPHFPKTYPAPEGIDNGHPVKVVTPETGPTIINEDGPEVPVSTDTPMAEPAPATTTPPASPSDNAAPTGAP